VGGEKSWSGFYNALNCFFLDTPSVLARRQLRNVQQYLLFAIPGIVFLSGCANTPYKFGTADRYRTSAELAARTEVPIERGQPNAVVDSIGWVWGIPGKIMLWDRRVSSHRIDEHTAEEIAAYLCDNELSTVKVRLNQYHPGDDWRRLAANKSVGAGWRYTVGALSVLGETVLPGRIFGSDHYNPYTNAIHLYSNVPAIALHEGGHAKDYAYRKWKGTYAFSRILPISPLCQEVIATNDALGYLKATRGLEAQQEGYVLLYPAFGSYVGAELSRYVPAGQLVGVLCGHAAGRWMSWKLEENVTDTDGNFLYDRDSVSGRATLSSPENPPAESESAEASPLSAQ